MKMYIVGKTLIDLSKISAIEDFKKDSSSFAVILSDGRRLDVKIDYREYSKNHKEKGLLGIKFFPDGSFKKFAEAERQKLIQATIDFNNKS